MGGIKEVDWLSQLAALWSGDPAGQPLAITNWGWLPSVYSSTPTPGTVALTISIAAPSAQLGTSILSSNIITLTGAAGTITPWVVGSIDPRTGGTYPQIGVPISLSSLYTSHSSNTTTFEVEIHTEFGGYLTDPNGNTYGYNQLESDSISNLSKWTFTPQSPGYDLIGLAPNGDEAGRADSVVLTGSNFVLGIDTPVDCTTVAQGLADAHYKFVIRYYWDQPNSSVGTALFR